MKHKFKFSSFLCGMLTMAVLTGCGTAALAAAGDGNVYFGSIGLSIRGKSVIEKGQTLTNGSGNEIPSSLLYTDQAGGGTTYLPIAAISELLDVPISWDGETGIVNLGNIPDATQVSFGVTPQDPTTPMPLHRAGAKAGHYTELEPYWPAEEEINATHEYNTTISSPNGFEAYYNIRGEQFSVSVTNQSEYPLIFKVQGQSTLNRDTIPETVVPVGETVIRTFSCEDYPAYLGGNRLIVKLDFDVSHFDLQNNVKAVINAVTYQPK